MSLQNIWTATQYLMIVACSFYILWPGAIDNMTIADGVKLLFMAMLAMFNIILDKVDKYAK